MFSKPRSVAWNTLVQIVAKAVGALAGLGMVVLLTRSLGDAGYGEYATVFAWVGVLIVFVDLGFYMTGLREMSRRGADQARIAGTLLTIKAVNAAAVAAVAILAVRFMPYDVHVRGAIMLSLVGVAAVSLLDPFKSLFQVRLRMEPPSVAEALGSLAALGAAVWLLLGRGAGLYAAVGCTVGGHVLALALTAAAALRVVRARPGFDARIAASLFRGALPLGLSGLLAVLYFRIDTLMLSWMRPLSDVGVYGASYKILEASTVLPVLLLGTVFPLLTRAVQAGGTEQERCYRGTMETLVLLAVPMVAGGLALAHELMLLVAGPAFVAPRLFDLPLAGPVALASAPATFAVLLAGAPLIFLGQLNGHMMLAAGRERALLALHLVIVPLNVALNLILISSYSFLGAAAATLVTEAVAIVITTVYVRRVTGMAPGAAPFLRALVAVVPMLLVVLWLEAHVLLRVLAGAACYGMVLRLAGWLPRLPEAKAGPVSSYDESKTA